MVVTRGPHKKHICHPQNTNQHSSEMPSHPYENGYCKTSKKKKKAGRSEINPATMGNSVKTPQEIKISWVWWYRSVIQTLVATEVGLLECQPSLSEIGPKLASATSQTSPKLRTQWIDSSMVL